MTPCRVLISCEPCDFVVGDPRVQPHHSKFSAAVQSAQMVGKAYCCILLQPILKQCRLTMSNATCVQSIRRLDGSIATNLCESASCVGTAVGQPRSFQCSMCTEGVSSTTSYDAPKPCPERGFRWKERNKSFKRLFNLSAKSGCIDHDTSANDTWPADVSEAMTPSESEIFHVHLDHVVVCI